MPLPKPRKGEKQADYVSRCIEFVKGEDPNMPNEQAAAMCYTSWRDAKRKEAESQMPRPERGERQFEFISRCTQAVLDKNEGMEPADATAACFTAWRERYESMHPVDAMLNEASTADWSTVDKSKLPAACFLWVGDPEKKATWKLPVYMGAGGIGEDGMYQRRGEINLNALRAASAAVGGARTGKPMSVPSAVKSKLNRLLQQYKIGQKSEADPYELYHTPDLHESADEISRFVEDVDFTEAEFDEEARIVRNVVLLGPKSSHGYTYEQGAMAGAVTNGLYEGARIFIDHSRERSLMSLAGVFRNTRHESGKIKGDAHLLANEGGKLFFDVARLMPEAASCSHVADGKLVKKGNRKYVEEITRVHSVDLVVQGATTKSVFEGHDGPSKGDGSMDWKDVTLEDLRAARPDLVTKLVQEGAQSRDDEVQALIKKNEGIEETTQELRVKLEGFEAAETVREKEAIVAKVMEELPEHARSDSLKALCLEAKSGKDGFNKTIFEEEVKGIVKSIKNAIEATGVKNMGGDRVVVKDADGKEQTVDEGAVDRALTLD